jgi:hypothetical protein
MVCLRIYDAIFLLQTSEPNPVPPLKMCWQLKICPDSICTSLYDNRLPPSSLWHPPPRPCSARSLLQALQTDPPARCHPHRRATGSRNHTAAARPRPDAAPPSQCCSTSPIRLISQPTTPSPAFHPNGKPSNLGYSNKSRSGLWTCSKVIS